MKSISNYLAAVLTGFLFGACVACGGSTASASSGPTTADFTALQAQVTALSSTVSTLQTAVTATQGAVAAVQSEIPHTLLVSTSSGGGSTSLSRRTLSLAPAGSTASAAVGTYMGPGTTISTPTQLIQSSTSYFAVTPTYPLTNVMLAGVYPIFYDGASCTGNAYMLPGPNVALGWLLNGIVVSPSNGAAQDYLYAPTSATESDVPFVMQSFLNGPNDCEAPLAPQPMSGVALLPNDPAVTGFQNAPVASLAFAP